MQHTYYIYLPALKCCHQRKQLENGHLVETLAATAAATQPDLSSGAPGTCSRCHQVNLYDS